MVMGGEIRGKANSSVTARHTLELWAVPRVNGNQRTARVETGERQEESTTNNCSRNSKLPFQKSETIPDLVRYSPFRCLGEDNPRPNPLPMAK